MYNFYQSPLRKYFNKDIAHKPVWLVTLFGNEYQYIIREKKLWWISLCWIQILWIIELEKHTLWEWKNELSSLNQKHNPIYIQLWSIDIVSTLSSIDLHIQTSVDGAKKTRITKQKKLISDGWILSSKENLPPSTYIVQTNESLELRTKTLWSQHATKIKKAQKNWILISEAQWQDEDIFFALLQQTGREKWFNIVWQKTYTSLIERIKIKDTWKLYVAKQWNNIIAWALYLIDQEQKTAIYLYWWTDKTHRNSWASQLLHREAMNLLEHKWINKIDLLWGGPTWFPEHHLSSVWTFKVWFWWDKIDYLWSFDIVYKKGLYMLRKKLR